MLDKKNLHFSLDLFVHVVHVPEEEMPTYIGKALLKVLEAQNVPVKIRKHFDRERFISDVRDFFVNVKGIPSSLLSRFLIGHQ